MPSPRSGIIPVRASKPGRERILLSCLPLWKAPLILATFFLTCSVEILEGLSC